MIIFDYVWLDEQGNLKTKTKVLQKLHENDWASYSGFFAGEVCDTEVFLCPKKLIENPFSKNDYIVICDQWVYKENVLCPHIYNTRHFCEKELKEHEPENMFEFMQDFYIVHDKIENKSLVQEDYTTITGNKQIVNEVMKKCLHSSINVTEVYRQNGNNQWCFHIQGYDVDAADQLVLFRYILTRVCEQYNAYPNFDPIPLPGMNPSGLMIKFGTPEMKGNYEKIQQAIKNLSKNHEKCIMYYGDNSKRMKKFHQTTFSFGISKYDVCVNIPYETFANKKGEIIDTRPASHANPYLVIQTIMEVIKN